MWLFVSDNFFFKLGIMHKTDILLKDIMHETDINIFYDLSMSPLAGHECGELGQSRLEMS